LFLFLFFFFRLYQFIVLLIACYFVLTRLKSNMYLMIFIFFYNILFLAFPSKRNKKEPHETFNSNRYTNVLIIIKCYDATQVIMVRSYLGSTKSFIVYLLIWGCAICCSQLYIIVSLKTYPLHFRFPFNLNYATLEIRLQAFFYKHKFIY
jgi:hypothetical protein